jgi:hypothetical protein
MSSPVALSGFPFARQLAPSRRSFLVGAATCTGALIVGTRIDLAQVPAVATNAQDAASPNAFVRIARDDTSRS